MPNCPWENASPVGSYTSRVHHLSSVFKVTVAHKISSLNVSKKIARRYIKIFNMGENL